MDSILDHILSTVKEKVYPIQKKKLPTYLSILKLMDRSTANKEYYKDGLNFKIPEFFTISLWNSNNLEPLKKFYARKKKIISNKTSKNPLYCRNCIVQTHFWPWNVFLQQIFQIKKAEREKVSGFCWDIVSLQSNFFRIKCQAKTLFPEDVRSTVYRSVDDEIAKSLRSMLLMLLLYPLSTLWSCSKLFKFRQQLSGLGDSVTGFHNIRLAKAWDN